MKNKIIRLKIPAGNVVVGQKLGSALSPYGINIKKIKDDLNDSTRGMSGNILVDVEIFGKGEYKLHIRKSPVSDMIKNHIKNKTISMLDIKKIAKEKMTDMNVIKDDLDSAVKIVLGSAKSIAGLVVTNE